MKWDHVKMFLDLTMLPKLEVAARISFNPVFSAPKLRS